MASSDEREAVETSETVSFGSSTIGPSGHVSFLINENNDWTDLFFFFFYSADNWKIMRSIVQWRFVQCCGSNDSFSSITFQRSEIILKLNRKKNEFSFCLSRTKSTDWWSDQFWCCDSFCSIAKFSKFTNSSAFWWQISFYFICQRFYL